MRTPPKRQLRIVGYDGTDVIFDRALPLHSIGDRQINELLLRLAATHLTPDEIVAASLKKGARGRSDHLALTQMSRERYGVATTGDPHYVAFTEEVGDAQGT